jgi:WD40 repeat protein
VSVYLIVQRFLLKLKNIIKIASSSGEGLIKIWDIDSSLAIGTLTGHVGDVWEIIPLSKSSD